MAVITAATIKELRELTSAGMMECKRALEECGGDFDKAKDILRQRGLEIAAKKSSRQAKEGRIEVYVHPGNKNVAMVELNCETDFVAKNEEFCKLAKDIAMQIVAMSPKYIRAEDVPADELSGQENQKEYIQQVCLLENAFIKDPSKKIGDLITALIAKTGENMSIGRFTRYKVGEIESTTGV
ncbi:MAG: translation elongation factor Ts [Candidatus Omnitrophica bacterium]|nr:translation elongation factor Ts [Candidatus Omnitrophota bacterium]